ncbi:hypothetical protein SAMN05444156_2691 [Verrucomicrobium sp. GAS474]|uniref:hypothetical protein n=1 Tax=Verrucomicrobium sp. GAS474 TaxID=1882831 RepID=UPI00087B25FC|nr:hypothetical protein [Verrucomicrobium sp. GAS474]SDU22166.1 hypothetical protein SAMN05444156_2691 [Verrucomicrobium sp. GAS474]
MKKSASSLLLVGLLALGAGISSLHAADDTTPGFSTSNGTLAKKNAAGPSLRKGKTEAEQPGVTYGGLGVDLYKKGPILLSPLAPANAGYGKSYFSSSATGPANMAVTHTAQKPTGGLSLFSIEF